MRTLALMLLAAGCATAPEPKPIFADVWAKWCHTCRYMNENVLNDPALAQARAKYEWRDIDREDPKNADFLAKYPSPMSPTYWIIDGKTGAPRLKWIGIATVAQMKQLLDGPGTSEADRAIERADRLDAAGKFADAAAGYREALRVAPAGWALHDRAVESLTFALDEAGDKKGCADAALELVPRMEHGPSFANAAGNGLACALKADEHIDELVPIVIDGIDSPNVGADRVSELFGLLVDASKKKGDAAGAHEWALKWIKYLEDEARHAKTPEARAVYDAHRLEAALELGEPGRAIPALEQSEKDLPNDFNPPARLCVAYLAADQVAEAEAACRRALTRGMDGPRRLRVLNSLADVLEKKGDRAGARAVIEDAIRFAELLPAPQRPDAALRRLRERLQSLK